MSRKPTEEQRLRYLAQKRQRYAENLEEMRARNRAWQQANPEKAKAMRKREYEKNKDKYLASNKARYDRKTRVEYNRRNKGMIFAPDQNEETMLAAQNGRCAICPREISPEIARSLHVDHCHKTGRVRGLLCRKCNLGLGNYDDTPEHLEKAAAYLRASEASAASLASSSEE
jgi:hypothetical protein